MTVGDEKAVNINVFLVLFLYWQYEANYLELGIVIKTNLIIKHGFEVFDPHFAGMGVCSICSLILLWEKYLEATVILLSLLCTAFFIKLTRLMTILIV